MHTINFKNGYPRTQARIILMVVIIMHLSLLIAGCVKPMVKNIFSGGTSDQGIRIFTISSIAFSKEHIKRNQEIFTCNNRVLSDYFNSIEYFSMDMMDNPPVRDLQKDISDLIKTIKGVKFDKIVNPLWSHDDRICLITDEINNSQCSIEYRIYESKTENTSVFFRYAFNKQFDYIAPEENDVWAYTYPYDLSTDKRYIAFVACENKQWDLWLYCRDPKGEGIDYFANENFEEGGENLPYLLKLTNDNHREIAPNFNIHGNKVLYTVLLNDGRYEVREFDLSSMTPTKVLTDDSNYIYARYAPYYDKGGYEWICYVNERGGNFSLGITQRNSYEKQIIADNLLDCRVFPTWCPNDKYNLIAYYRGNTIEVYDLKENNLKSVIVNVSIPKKEFLPTDLGPQWTYGGNYIIYPKIEDDEANAQIDIFGITTNIGTHNLDKGTKGGYIRELSAGSKNISYIMYNKYDGLWKTMQFGIKKQVVSIRKETNKIFRVKLYADSSHWKDRANLELNYTFGQIERVRSSRYPYKAPLADSEVAIKNEKITTVSDVLELNKQFKCLRLDPATYGGDLNSRDKRKLLSKDITIYIDSDKSLREGQFIYLISHKQYLEMPGELRIP